MIATHRYRARGLAGVAIAGTLLLGACQMAPAPKVDAKTQENLAVTQNQARLLIRGQVRPMCGDVEQAADEIMAGTTDRDVRMAALKWKMEAVPALRESLYQPEWSMAAFDTLVLCEQMTAYFETGPGKKSMGAASTQAAAACKRTREEFALALASGTTSGDVSRLGGAAHKWAAEHPMLSSIGNRPSPVTHGFERDLPEGVSTGQVIVDATMTLDDLNRKAEVYSDQLFRQARWEAERFKIELFEELHAEKLVPAVDSLVPAVEKMVPAVERMVPAIENLVPAIEKMAPAVAIAAQATGAAERAVGTLERVAPQAERVMKIAEDTPRLVASEREAVLKELQATVIQQRQQILIEADQMVVKYVDYTLQRVTRLLVWTFVAVALLGLAGMIAARFILVRRVG